MKRAFFLILPNAHILDLAGPLQIIATLHELNLAAVSTHCIGPQDRLPTFQQIGLARIAPLPAALVDGDVLFVIGSKLDLALTTSAPWQQSIEWLRQQSQRLKSKLPVYGICTGTFLLAAAGLLNGRICTTHHGLLAQLRSEYPAIHVVENRVLVQDGHLWTSAGVASGMDLALQVLAHFFGDEVAIQVARENVLHFRRFGSDPALSASLSYRAHANQLVHAVQDTISKQLAHPISCQDLAAQFGLSDRHLARLFINETGITAKRYQLELRMALAQRLLADSSLSLENIVERCGFGSVQAFRANWNKMVSLPPSQSRKSKR